MRKLFAVLALACACLTCFAATAAAKPAATKPAAAKPATAKLTIHSFPGGLFGYLSSAEQRCQANRKVVVYLKRGDRPEPATDPVVGTDKTAPDEGSYRYSVETTGTGDFYAQVAAKKGCAAAQTGSVEAMQVGAGAGASDVPVCSPYTAEGPSEICRLPELNYDLYASGTTACAFGKASYSCEGIVSGVFPWGDAGGGESPKAVFNWAPAPQPGQRSVVIISELSKSAAGLLTRMDCRSPGPASADLTVDKAIVKTDTGTAEFYTPDLPGQAAGEPGGPLYLNFESGKYAFGLGAKAHINGYLYVKN
jgi:hypothetical protein